MKTVAMIAALAASTAALPAFAEGDPAEGEDGFKRCKSCHMVVDGDNEILKGGRTGPNLFGIVGRQAGTVEDFNYGDDLVAAGEAGLVWDEENLVAYMTDPTAFLREFLEDDSARSKMTFKLRNGGEDIVAFLASVAPDAGEGMEEGAEEEGEEAESTETSN
ncbi:c-type cytochrome [Aliiroseovarius sp. YM-037]|uniref:c-type cytochrome n=1 Tax=Aliiroseovarius sp. YM-037 TaxID=3341728 RepID=UPI003A7FF9BB